jgi:hypothetical protein
MRTLGLVGIIAAFGCVPEFPPLEYHGERVVVGSDVIDQVCGGTLARLDREVVQIEKRLDLGPQSDPLQVYIVSSETVADYCVGANCVKYPSGDPPYVMLDHSRFGRAAAHELTHARLAHQRSTPLFAEGVAEAISPPSCPKSISKPGDAASLLAASKSSELRDLGGYYVAGEFVAWLLEEFGSKTFLSLYTDIDRGTSTSTIEAAYRDHFGRDIEDDLFAHMRTQDQLDALPPEHFGCLAPAAPTNAGAVTLKASLDCDSQLVQNTPGLNGTGYVEWTLSVDHDQRFDLVGTVPAWTILSVQACGCEPRPGLDFHLLPQTFDETALLQRGTYRLRWFGALDEGHALDVELVPLD